MTGKFRNGSNSRTICSQFIEWGLDYSGDGDDSSLNFRLGYLNSAVDTFGSEFRILGQIGEDPQLLADLYKYVNPHLKIVVNPKLFVERREVTAYEDGDPVLVTEVTQYGGSFSVGREFSRHAALAVGVRSFSGEVVTEIGPDPDAEFDYQGGEYFVRGIYDRLDDRYFPGEGALMDVSYQKADEALGADDEYEQVTVDSLIARSFGRHTVMAGARYYETLEDISPVYALFRGGGFVRLSGYHDQELAGQNFSMVMAGYRYHFAGSGLLPAYLGTTLEYGQVAETTDDLYDDALLNGSLYFGYRSPIGPLYLGIGLGEGGRQRVFLRMGNVFGQSTIGR